MKLEAINCWLKNELQVFDESLMWVGVGGDLIYLTRRRNETFIIMATELIRPLEAIREVRSKQSI